MSGTHLEDLPAEVLLRVFQNLDNIDDAFHLGRSCRRLYQILDRPGHRFTIMRSIIIQSPYHRYDLQVSHMSQFHAECMKIYADQPRLPVSSRPEYTIIKKFKRLRSPTKQLLSSPEVVFEVVCRWQAMKVLFDVYCDMPNSLNFLHSGGHIGVRTMATLYDEPENQLLPLETLPNIQGLPAAEKKRAYQRLYRALMVHWTNLESAWLARICKSEIAAEHIMAFDEVYDMWSCNPDRALQEKFDIIEVVDFLRYWLVENVIFQDRPCLLDWFDSASQSHTPADLSSPLHLWLSHVNDDMEPRDYSAELSDLDFLEVCSELFVEDMAQHLRPPHVIELLSLLAWAPTTSWKIDRPRYVRQLGMMDTLYIWELRGEQEQPPRYTPELLEDDVQGDLENIGCEVQEEELADEIKRGCSLPGRFISLHSVKEECSGQWRQYREKDWVSEMRRQVLFRQESEGKLFERIICLEKLYLEGDTYPESPESGLEPEHDTYI
ncbi:F-box protein [Aspergillus clavatus NRRL 1]|uniref:F-box domain protein n=1 Tax=Aspergillus clavatus (strain ATCC 1007 / CBS 513.65 / DSM 816 / NCTC 3887 / NRRL 1 / QM 1276 / 107) TaxID=344612 RepID=A1C9N7_ASPCL|nr:F-box domain protein [Aspergillus clavatus NRRL 1]EAW13561.1 F-box domain protein [Aspergillus clavatus NRRL 1]